jgi:hypothetical protein
VLEKAVFMTDLLSECKYTFLTLEHLLIFNPMVNLKYNSGANKSAKFVNDVVRDYSNVYL